MPQSNIELGRFAEPSLLILVSLAEGPKHGYAIQHDVAQVSGRRLGPGTLYGAIARLEAAGYIEPIARDGDRRPYRLTATGARALASELAAHLEQVNGPHTARVLTSVGLVKVSGTKAAVENHIAFVKRNRGR